MLVDHKENTTAKKKDKITIWATDQKMGHSKTTFTYPKRQLQGDKITTWWTGPSSNYSRTGRIKTRLAHFSGRTHSLFLMQRSFASEENVKVNWYKLGKERLIQIRRRNTKVINIHFREERRIQLRRRNAKDINIWSVKRGVFKY